jgi:hypothetical protein
MARSLLQRRLENDRQRIAALDAALKYTHHRRKPKSCDYHEIALTLEWVSDHKPHLIRTAADWKPQLKTRDESRATLAAARHLFARFPAPAHLERIWLETAGLDRKEIAFRKLCWFAVVSGESLFRLATSSFLSRRETHAFLTPPQGMTFAQALTHAIARSYTEDAGLARRIAASKLALADVRAQPFWREANRFFATHAAPREAIDDLCDFLLARLVDDPGFRLKGRTLRSLGALEREWRESLMIVRRFGESRWTGEPIADWIVAPTDPRHPLFGSAWSVVQLTSLSELVDEGVAQRHCVATYERGCREGRCSIWSLRRRVDGRMERVLTLELTASREVTQIRGRANRLATRAEREVLRVWAAERGVYLDR